MPEKRFEAVFSGDRGDVYIGINDNQNDDLLMTMDTIDKLNEFHEENLFLKQENQQYKILVKSLKDQNQKLKLRLEDLGVEYL